MWSRRCHWDAPAGACTHPGCKFPTGAGEQKDAMKAPRCPFLRSHCPLQDSEPSGIIKPSLANPPKCYPSDPKPLPHTTALRMEECGGRALLASQCRIHFKVLQPCYMVVQVLQFFCVFFCSKFWLLFSLRHLFFTLALERYFDSDKIIVCPSIN